MKVALVGRSSMHTVKGGDTLQIMKTAAELNKFGVEAKVFLASEEIPYDQFDLLHLFNIIRPADHLKHIKKSKKPYVISTIYLDYTNYDRKGRSFAFKSLFRILGENGSEYFKNNYRYLKGQDKMVSKSYLLGHKRAMLKVLSSASLLLPNSISEYNRLAKATAKSWPYRVITNGIDTDIFGDIPSGIQRKKKVISVAQIYGMKNQHMLIMACEKLGYPLEIIGKPPPNHSGYYEYCKSIAGGQVKFVSFMPQKELIRHYAASEVHALPSWFETTGLTSLEAGSMGCKLVVGKGGDTHDYFGHHAHYCDADDLNSIVEALKNAMEAKPDEHLRELIMNKFTWKIAAKQTIEAYNQVLHG
jgi:glycosyltransferase involved in cell wall biosynthesis